MPSCKDHVRDTSACPEATLTLWYDGGGADDASKDFSSNRQKWHTAVVVTAGAISFLLVDVHYESIFEVLWDAAFAPYLSEQVD